VAMDLGSRDPSYAERVIRESPLVETEKEALLNQIREFSAKEPAP